MKFKLILLLSLFASLGCPTAKAQGSGTNNLLLSVTNLDLVTATHERVLRIEGIVPAPAAEVWKAFSTAEGLKTWIAPVVSIDLRVGGVISTHYTKTATIGSPGTINLPIINYLEGEMLTLKVNLNENFTAKARAEDKNLQEIIQIIPASSNSTRVVSSMIGWGTGKEWDDTYKFFSRGNAWTYRELIQSFLPKPK